MTKQTRWWFFLFALSVVSLAACAQEPPASEPSEEPESRPDLSTPSPEPASTVTPEGGIVRPVPTLPYTPSRVELTPPITGGEVPQSLLDQMLDDLAAQVGAARQEIIVVSAEAIVWNDGSLGCPKPGEFYTQALVPGYRVTLETGGQRYTYHASENGYFFLCTASLPGRNQIPGGSTPSQ